MYYSYSCRPDKHCDPIIDVCPLSNHLTRVLKSFCLLFQMSLKAEYGKNSKNRDTIMITVIVVKVEWYGFTLQECTQKA